MIHVREGLGLYFLRMIILFFQNSIVIKALLSLHNYILAFYVYLLCYNLFILQIKELVHINIPVMLMPNDFKAYTKVKVDNHLFNK